MQFFRSSKFLTLMFLSVTLAVGCISMIAVSGMNMKWIKFQEKAQQTGHWTVEETTQLAEKVETATPQTWIVRAYEDRIGVFDLNGKLEYAVDVYLITLPPADQELLKQGIYVKGQDQLTALMEDYTG